MFHCYSKLYDSNKPDVNEINIYLSENTENANKLNNIDKGICDQPIDSNELDDVENSLKTNKSPGSDGLGPEFYQQYWKYLKPLYIEMLNESYEKG